MPKTVIFDFDGTIADSIPSNEYIFKVFNKIADENKFRNITLEEIESLRDIGLYESVKLLKIPFYKIPFIAKRVQQVIRAGRTVPQPVKNIPQTLTDLKTAGYALGIMTSNKKSKVEQFLEAYKLELFNFVYSGSNLFGKDKVLTKILKKHKIDTKNSVYIGDEIRDIQAAKRIGLLIVAVSWGYNSKNGLLAQKPDFLVEKPQEIKAALNKIFRF